MSVSSWYKRNAFWVAYFVAFFVIIPSITWLAFNVEYEAAYQDYATAQAQQKNHYALQLDCFALIEAQKALDCLRIHIEPNREQERAEEDLRAQKDMANWALGLPELRPFSGF